MPLETTLLDLRSVLTRLLRGLVPGPGTQAVLSDVLVVLGTFVGLLFLWLLFAHRSGGSSGEEAALEAAREKLREEAGRTWLPLAASSIHPEMAAAQDRLQEAGIESRVDADRPLPIGPTFFTWYGLYVPQSDTEEARELLEGTGFDELLLPAELVEKVRRTGPDTGGVFHDDFP